MEKKKIGIIGGGISGACLGYHLSLYDNAEVIVFEKDTIGGASTAKSAGTVCLFDDSLLYHNETPDRSSLKQKEIPVHPYLSSLLYLH